MPWCGMNYSTTWYYLQAEWRKNDAIYLPVNNLRRKVLIFTAKQYLVCYRITYESVVICSLSLETKKAHYLDSREGRIRIVRTTLVR